MPASSNYHIVYPAPLLISMNSGPRVIRRTTYEYRNIFSMRVQQAVTLFSLFFFKSVCALVLIERTHENLG